MTPLLPAMNKNLRLFFPALAMSLGLSAWCAAQRGADEPWVEERRRQKELAEEGEKAVAALRADLAGPWTSVIITCVYDCSCTGPAYSGFCLKRANGAMTVEPWRLYQGLAPVGVPRPITQPEVDRLLSETVLFYLAATLSVSPWERAGPFPNEPAEVKVWNERLLAAGGSLEASDAMGIEVRVTTPKVVRRHSNRWAVDCPQDFTKWVAAFGTLP
jgi:hypothetical protein